MEKSLCAKYGVKYMAQIAEFGLMAEKEITDKRILKIAERLKKLRVSKGYTSYENFAFDNELPRRSYWRMENGTNFRIESLLRILDIHKITLEEFFSKDFEKKY